MVPLSNDPVAKRTVRRLGWRLGFVGVGMVLLHFTFILPIMNGYELSPISLLLALGTTGTFLRIWNERGNAIEVAASIASDGTPGALGAARLGNPVANWKATWPVLTLLTAPITILLLIAIIGPP